MSIDYEEAGKLSAQDVAERAREQGLACMVIVLNDESGEVESFCSVADETDLLNLSAAAGKLIATSLEELRDPD